MPNVYQYKDFEGSSHRILVELIRRHANRRGTLLDLGAAGGELGLALHDHFDKTIGFELNTDCMASLRRSFHRVVVSDLQMISRLPSSVDVIVLADVLEHLRDASQILNLARAALRPDGLLFVSVPNIANITIRIGLLFGIFRYRERGILDETHLRFYTLRTIREQLEAAGFRLVATRGSSVPIRLIVGSVTPEPIIRIGERLLVWLTRAWKKLFAYQIILIARPK